MLPAYLPRHINYIVKMKWIVLGLAIFLIMAGSGVLSVDAQSPNAVPTVGQWVPYDLSFTAEQNHFWYDFPLQVIFRHSGGKELELDGYWDGGNSWKVRFAPPLAGSWTWASTSNDPGLGGKSGSLNAESASENQIAANPNFRGHVRVSSNGRYFTYADGTPFFLIGDTNWAMNTRRAGLGTNSDGPFFTWLNDRKQKKYTTIFTAFIRTYKNTLQANEGGAPFPSNLNNNGNYTELNPDFFKQTDPRVNAIWEEGFVIAAHPMWIGKHVSMSLRDAKRFSRYVMARYGAYNLVWSLAGEYQYSYVDADFPWDIADWRALGSSVQSNNAYNHPVSVHPSGKLNWSGDAAQQSSGGEFHNDGWLDHNWVQSGQRLERLWMNPFRSLENYERTPVKPVIHAEGFYENIKSEGASAGEIRWQAWAAFLNGATGHGYGAAGIYQFYDPNDNDARQSVPWDGTPWWEALNHPGSSQLQYVREFLTSFEWWKLEPHRDWIRMNGTVPDVSSLTDPHLAANPGEVYTAYVPAGNQGNTLKLTNLQNIAYTARWFNPRNGSYSSINAGNPINVDTNTNWTAPPVPSSADWVLQLRVVTSSKQPIFGDVPLDHPFNSEIEALYQAGYTAGCQAEPLLFCPEATMNRAESAVFVQRGIHGAGVIPVDPTSQIFADVALDSWAAKWAAGLYEDGFTAGCSEAPLMYCPWQGHTRTEGTVFYLRMLNGADYLPPEPVGVFADVALDFWGADWIEAAYAEGLIPACGENPLRFCPDEPLTRAVAAYMMVQAKNLPRE